MGLPDSRYRFTVFREVHLWPPILTPGEPTTTELQNADRLGAVWKQIAPTSFCPRQRPSAESTGARHESAVSRIRTGRRCPSEGRIWVGRGWLKRKRAALIKAPPLKGSDTSVSSPKRQTAEAVRALGSRKRRVESSGILRGCYQHPARIGRETTTTV